MGAKILVVDDDPAVRELTSFTLESAGYSVTQASNGAQALQIWAREPADLVVLDVTMPDMSGRDVARALRDNGSGSAVPIVMLSALASDRDQWEGWRAGVDIYMTKPFECDKLVAQVRRLLQQAPTPS